MFIFQTGKMLNVGYGTENLELSKSNYTKAQDKNFGEQTIDQSQKAVHGITTQNDHQKEVQTSLLALGEKIGKITNMTERDKMVQDYKWMRLHFDYLTDPVETAKRVVADDKDKTKTDKELTIEINNGIEVASGVYTALKFDVNAHASEVTAGLTGNETTEELTRKLEGNLRIIGGERLVTAWRDELDRMINTLAIVLGIKKTKEISKKDLAAKVMQDIVAKLQAEEQRRMGSKIKEIGKGYGNKKTPGQEFAENVQKHKSEIVNDFFQS